MNGPNTIKIVVALRRAPGTTVEAFQATAPPPVLAAGLHRHVRSLTLPGGYRRGEPVYDAVHELWFDDEAAARAAVPGLSAIVDAPGHDPASVAVLVTREHTVVDGPVPAGAVKNIEFVTRRADLPYDEFVRYWATVHGPLAARIDVIRRYVQAHGLRAPGLPQPWDGLAITWFDDVAAVRRSASTPEYAATRADEPNFLALGELPFLITTEREVAVG